MQVALLTSGIRQLRIGLRAGTRRRSQEDVLEQMEAGVAERWGRFADFEASLRHFVSRFLCHEVPGKTLLGVVSADTGDGRTTVAIDLAKALSDVYTSVVLVELAEGEGIRDQLLLPPRPGLRDYLAGAADIDDVLAPTRSEKLWLVPAGSRPDPAHSLELVERTCLLLESLRPRFDVVVVDMPPVLRNEESPALLRGMDAVVLLTSAGRTRMDDVIEAMRLCGNVPVRGVLLNRFRGMPRWITSLVEP